MSERKARRGSLVAQIRAVVRIVIAVVSTKGGGGKSTFAWNLAHEISERGANVLLINTDHIRTVLDAASVRTRPEKVRVIDYPHVSIWEDLPRLAEGYDVVIIDGHGRHDRMTRAVIAAAATDPHGVLLVPIEVGPENYWPARRDMGPILREARDAYGPVRVLLVLNKYHEREVLTDATRRALDDADIAPTSVAGIERHTTYSKALSQGLAVCEYEPRGAAARDIAALATETIKLALSPADPAGK